MLPPKDAKLPRSNLSRSKICGFMKKRAADTCSRKCLSKVTWGSPLFDIHAKERPPGGLLIGQGVGQVSGRAQGNLQPILPRSRHVKAVGFAPCSLRSLDTEIASVLELEVEL